VEQKASILWTMGRLDDAVRSVEANVKAGPGGETCLALYKQRYTEEYGLEYGDATMKKIERFTKWMKDNGAKFNKIRMKYYGPDYRGVHSYKQINATETFLWVPRKLIITPQSGRETEIGKLVHKAGIKLSWEYLIYITIFLMEQFHDENSWWKPYMDVYPKSVDSFPMFYSEEEKNLLVGSPIMDQIASEIREIREEYDRIVSAVPQFKKFSFDEYIKNKTLVISRIFFVKIHGNNDRIMVPLAGTRF